MRALGKTIAKRLLGTCGLTVSRIDGSAGTGGYISAHKTVKGARQAGLSVGEYVEQLWDKQGDTQKVIDAMAAQGAFATPAPHVVEIGAGTGRYLDKVLQACQPTRYESYETAQDWADWLQAEYPIESHKADGRSLADTGSDSVDLLHAHGVFVYLPFLTCYRYWLEMWRVVKAGGVVVFDIISENCLDETTVQRWLDSQHHYPCFLSKEYVVSLFEPHGFSLTHSFENRYGEGRSEYLIFHRHQADGPNPIAG